MQNTKKTHIPIKVHNKSSKSLVIFASGNGSNALNIIKYFKNHTEIKIAAVFCNKPYAKVILKAEDENIPVFIFNNNDLQHTEKVLNQLKYYQTDAIILAGFLLKIPENIIKQYADRIINIHPALLPKYGGKGMYGMHVHNAVVEQKEKESGITIHYVNKNYDEGAVIFQAKCEVLPSDNPEDVASKIHDLEMRHFPKVIELTLMGSDVSNDL